MATAPPSVPPWAQLQAVAIRDKAATGRPHTIIDIVDTVEERRWRYLLSCFDIIIIIQIAVFCVDIVDILLRRYGAGWRAGDEC